MLPANEIQNSSTESRFWKIAPGEKASEWDECRTGGYICLGWGEVGDLNLFDDLQSLKKAMVAANRKDNEGQVSQVWHFRHLGKGDIVVANRGMTSIVGVGRVTGPYFFNTERNHFQHCVPVEWFHTAEYPIADRDLVKTWFAYTVKELTREEYDKLSAGMQARSALRWRRLSEHSFDLLLENVESLNRAVITHLYDQFMKSDGSAQPSFSKHLRDGLSAWIANPEGPLPSAAYVSLSNWFMTSFAALKSSERAPAAGSFGTACFFAFRKGGFHPLTQGRTTSH